jgi:hypothetical protein
VYRCTVWYDADDDRHAEEVAHVIATACDETIGRPASDDHDITYVLLWEPAANDKDFDQWAKENLFREGVRGVILPRPYAAGPLQ